MVLNMYKKRYHTITLDLDTFERIKKFAKNYNMSISYILKWFIITIINEDGIPNIDEIKEIVEMRKKEFLLDKDSEYVSLDEIEKTYGINKDKIKKMYYDYIKSLGYDVRSVYKKSSNEIVIPKGLLDIFLKKLGRI